MSGVGVITERHVSTDELLFYDWTTVCRSDGWPTIVSDGRSHDDDDDDDDGDGDGGNGDDGDDDGGDGDDDDEGDGDDGGDDGDESAAVDCPCYETAIDRQQRVGKRRLFANGFLFRRRHRRLDKPLDPMNETKIKKF